jgi:hypothetical protein
MLSEEEITAAVTENPACCGALYWGSRLACVVVTLKATNVDLLRDFLVEAWYRKAPKNLAREFANLSKNSGT